jgi:hypothetical protein
MITNKETTIDTLECPATVLAFALYHMFPGQDPETFRLRNKRLIT